MSTILCASLRRSKPWSHAPTTARCAFCVTSVAKKCALCDHGSEQHSRADFRHVGSSLARRAPAQATCAIFRVKKQTLTILTVIWISKYHLRGRVRNYLTLFSVTREDARSAREKDETAREATPSQARALPPSLTRWSRHRKSIVETHGFPRARVWARRDFTCVSVLTWVSEQAIVHCGTSCSHVSHGGLR